MVVSSLSTTVVPQPSRGEGESAAGTMSRSSGRRRVASAKLKKEEDDEGREEEGKDRAKSGGVKCEW